MMIAANGDARDPREGEGEVGAVPSGDHPSGPTCGYNAESAVSRLDVAEDTKIAKGDLLGHSSKDLSSPHERH